MIKKKKRNKRRAILHKEEKNWDLSEMGDLKFLKGIHFIWLVKAFLSRERSVHFLF